MALSHSKPLSHLALSHLALPHLTLSRSTLPRLTCSLGPHSAIRGFCIGLVRAFDKHMNLVLWNVVEDALEWLYRDPEHDPARIEPPHAVDKEADADETSIRKWAPLPHLRRD